jgi:zinc transporter ZupT
METEPNKDQKAVLNNIGYYQTVGGVTGIGFAIYQLSKVDAINQTIAMLYLFCLAVSALSVYSGQLLVKGKHTKGLQFSLLSQVLQVFNFTLSGITLKFVAGIMLSLGISYTETFKIISGFSLAENTLNFNASDNSVVLSINIVALFLVYLIDKIQNDIEDKEILLENEANKTIY